MVWSLSIPLIHGNVHLEFTHNLTIWKIWVSLDTGIRSLGSGIEEVELVDISWSEFSSLNGEVSEKSGSLVNSSNESGTDVGFSIRIFPSILFGNIKQLVEGHISLIEDVGDLVEIKSGGIESHVKSFSHEGVDWGWEDSLESSKQDVEVINGGDGWDIFSNLINPSEQEVVVSIW